MCSVCCGSKKIDGHVSLLHSSSLSYTITQQGLRQPISRLCILISLSFICVATEVQPRQTLESITLPLLSCIALSCQDSASLKVSSSCTPMDLMEQAVRKWLTTHGPEEEALRGQYVLRVSHCLEFLCGDHPLIQYKVSVCAAARSGVCQ